MDAKSLNRALSSAMTVSLRLRLTKPSLVESYPPGWSLLRQREYHQRRAHAELLIRKCRRGG